MIEGRREETAGERTIGDLPLLAGEPRRSVRGEREVRQVDANAGRDTEGARRHLAFLLSHDRAGLHLRRDLCQRSLRSEQHERQRDDGGFRLGHELRARVIRLL